MDHERESRLDRSPRLSVRPLAAALLLLAGLGPPAPRAGSLAALPSPGFAEHESSGRYECLGLLDDREAAKLAGGHGVRLLGFEALPVLLHETVTSRDSLYVLGLLRTIHPYMVAVLGPPVGMDTLGIAIDSTLVFGAYTHNTTIVMPSIAGGLLRDSDGDGLVDEDPYNALDDDGDGHVDEDPDNSPRWDNIFIHETTHAWQNGLMDRDLVSTWLIEAFAMASEYFVAREAAEKGCERPVGGGDAGTWVASLDAVDRAGAQVLGGSGRVVDRADSWTGYRNAGAAILLPALAEMLAGRGDPHPIRRLAREMEIEGRKDSGRDLWAAFDRAWSAPVDGILPPSRWVRARPIACPKTRNGSFLAVLPFGEQGVVDPDRMNLLFFERTDPWTHHPLDCSGEATVTGADGGIRRLDPEGNVLWLGGIPLSPGAYRIGAEERGAAGEELAAENWVLFSTSRHFDRGREATVAVIFARPDGRPYDPPDLRTNGRILERVPGAAFIELPGGGALSCWSGDLLLGTVSVPDQLPRTAILQAGRGKEEGVVTWTPYRPASGEPITVSIRRSQSALGPDGGEVVLEANADRRGGPSLRIPLEADAGDPDRLSARFVFPENESVIVLAFRSGNTLHWDGADGRRLLRSYAMPLEERRTAALLSARVEGDRLSIAFDSWANPSRLRLSVTCGEGDDWSERPDPPLPDDTRSETLAWSLPSARDPGCRYRVWEEAEGERSLLASLDESVFAEEGRPPVVSDPCPNPSRSGMRWRIESSRSTAARFDVFDVSGRRVYGPEEVRLERGTTTIDWDERPALGALPSGLYLLRLEGPGFLEKRKAVVLR